MDFGDYSLELTQVYQKNPLVKLQELYDNGEITIEPRKLFQLIISVRKKWEEYKQYDVQCGIIISNDLKGDHKSNIHAYNYKTDFSRVIQSRDEKSILYYVDQDGSIIKSEFVTEQLNYLSLVEYSKHNSSVCLYLGIQGIDVLINGVPFESGNRLDNYSDVINVKTLVDISHYKDLLERFFNEKVQYDTFKHYFVYKNELPKSLYGLLDKHPKLLKVKPEERFQRELEYFLRENCRDQVLTEVRNKFGERYDVWIATRDDKLYVFEIKWLGKSITAEGNVFREYDDPERAIEGAYQLKKYVDDRESYSKIIGGDFRIYCGVLLIYDARENMSTLTSPPEFDQYPQIDLSQHYKMEKDNIPASQHYSRVIKTKTI
ncbi:hypothetical protein [Brevibacillus sp. SIMBA_040]|uniref:hypothetical protein n=1 Tax=unclassified Brevibacillus TaxID=2684853 RepID=UPI003978AA3E